MDNKSIDQTLKNFLENAKNKSFNDSKPDIIKEVTKSVSDSFAPVFEQLSNNSRVNKDDLKAALSEIQINSPEVHVPEMKIPNIQIPTPIVHIPAPIINIPETKFPAFPEFPSEMSLKAGSKPFPVIMMDQGGKPMLFPVAGSAGPGFPMQVLDQTNNALRVSGSFSVTSSNASTQIIDSSLNAVGTASNPLNVAVVSGAASSTKAQIGNSDGDFSQANPLPVTFAAAGSQNVNVFDAQASSITSHAGRLEDFRGIDTVQLGVINVMSVLNSTVVTLGSGATFTGTPEDVKDFASISVQVFADQVSATDGLSIQQSSDGSNWDITDTYTVPASTGKTFSVQPTSRYLRVVYTNGATIQGAFRLSPTFHYHASQPSSQRSSDAYTNETDLQQFWSFNSHFNGTTWDRQSNQSGVSTNALRVQLATDSVASTVINSGTLTAVTNITNSIAVVQLDRDGNPIVQGPIGEGDAATALRVVLANNVAYSTAVTGTVVVSGITASTQSSIIDSSGVQYSGSNPFPFTLVTNATSTMNVALTDSGGVQYSGSNPVPITVVSGALTSTISVGDSAARSADNGGNPVKIGAIARTTNPTAYADGDRANLSTDKMGRLLTRPIQVRDLVATAYATLSTQAETTILAATAGIFQDLVMITATNASASAWKIDIRAVTGGNIIHTMNVPAGTGPIGWAPPLPWPQDATGNNWTGTISSGSDVSNANLFISGLFTKEL